MINLIHLFLEVWMIAKKNVCQNDSFWSIFWGWNDFKPTFFHLTNTFFEIKICDLIRTNIET